jgi:hypothetical protein
LSCDNDNNLTVTSTFIVGSGGEQLDVLNANGAAYSNVFAHGQLLATYQFPSSSWTYPLEIRGRDKGDKGTSMIGKSQRETEIPRDSAE